MRTNNIEVTYTVTIPFNTPDKNGVVYTRSAIEDALHNMPAGLPVRFVGNDASYSPHLIGVTTSQPYAVQFDDEHQVCTYWIDGNIRYGGTECIIEKSNDGIIEKMIIVGFGLSE